MPRYTVQTRSFLNDRLYEPGEHVETDLPPGPHMHPAKDSHGKEDPKAREAKDKAGNDAAPMPDNPNFIGDLINKNLAGGGTEGAREDGMIGQMSPPGIKVNATGQVIGVTDAVGAGDAGDGSNAVAPDGEVGHEAKPPAKPDKPAK